MQASMDTQLAGMSCAARLAATAPLSQASTACASPRHDEADDNMLQAVMAVVNCHHTYAREKLPDDAEERQGNAQIRRGHPGAGSNCDSSDKKGLDAGEEDEQYAGVVVSEDEMQARVANAMRGLDRLQQMNMNPRELPTIRALFVRWTISQWALQGPTLTHSSTLPPGDSPDGAVQEQVTVEAGLDQVATAHSVMAGSGRDSVSRRKRAGGDSDIDSCVAENVLLGHIRGPGCCVVKARRI
jgi:hypothetical protein